MASYQNPNRSADSLPPSSLNWGDSLEPQDEPPSGHAHVPPPPATATPMPPPPAPPGYASQPPGPAIPDAVQVQHTIQPHPHVAPQPYAPPAPPLHDVPPPYYVPSDSYPSSGGQSFGYAANVYSLPQEGAPTTAPASVPMPMPPRQPTADPGVSGKAKAALWIGVFGGWLPINLFVALAAIVETGPGRKRGRDRAVIGLCCSLVWVVLIGGITYAVRHNQVDAPPPIPRLNAQGATTDPGCWAGANAVYAYQGTAENAPAQLILGNALVNAANKSRVADAPLRKLGLDYLAMAQGSDVNTLVVDADAAGKACGLSFKVS